MSATHLPVLLKEVIECFDPQPGQNFIDGTFGQGGHSYEILKRIGEKGKLLGIDADSIINNQQATMPPLAGLRWAGSNQNNLILINDNFVNLKKIYEHNFPYAINGILFDLGLSTALIESSGRGFSFLRREPLDMRFDPKSQKLTAAEVLNQYSLENLEKVFRELGEIYYARRLALAVGQQRKNKKFDQTTELVELINRVAGRGRGKRINPATQVFQALRIEVNNELGNLLTALSAAYEIIASGGKIIVISFHSLEDRIVKNTFRTLTREGKARLLTKKPIVASENEVRENPRSRSAKMRAMEKI